MSQHTRIFLVSIVFFLFITKPDLKAQQLVEPHDVFITGNLVDIEDHDAFVAELDKLLKSTQYDFSLVLIGDFIDGPITTPKSKSKLALLTRVMQLFDHYEDGHLYLLPGDRDWNDGEIGGYKNLQKLETFVNNYNETSIHQRIKWIAEDACPGPYEFSIAPHLVGVGVNSQWWNHKYDKARASDAICDYITLRDIEEEIEDIVDENSTKNVLFLTHHPIWSVGNYGGYFSTKDHLSPFPVLGSFKTAFHSNIGSKYDINNERLEPYIHHFDELLYANNNIVIASAHDKNQQILRRDNNYQINSGSFEQGRFAGQGPYNVHASSQGGIMNITYYGDGSVESTIFYSGGQSPYSKRLYAAVCDSTFSIDDFTTAVYDDTPINESYIPCAQNKFAADVISYTLNDVATVAAGPEYEAGGFKKFLVGDHYRSSWIQPVETRFLDLDTTYNGLLIVKKGGGRQTTSLRFVNPEGTNYSFRSVNKDPTSIFTHSLQSSIISRLFKDQTSSQQPYGALVSHVLLDKLDILHPHPRLFLLPDHPNLGVYRENYRNLLGMLEEQPGKANLMGNHFGEADDIHKSQRTFKEIIKSNRNRIDHQQFVKARMFDILVGDWSKHEDNWKWAEWKNEDTNIFEPIPRDRDHVFSRLDGLIPYLADRKWGVPNIETFDSKIKGLRSLVYQARHLDRVAASEAIKDDFINAAKFIQENLSDEDIENAMRELPPEVHNIEGETLISHLKQRKKDLVDYANKFYLILNKDVDILGSAKKEYFDIYRNADGRVHVKQYDSKGGKRTDLLLFHRTFYPSETKDIKIYGLGDDDTFTFYGCGPSKIKIRVIGGAGKDQFVSKSSCKAGQILLYDNDVSTKYDITEGFKVVNHWNGDLYEYDRLRFEYNRTVPLAGISFDRFQGTGISAGFRHTRQHFSKPDFSSIHTLKVGVTTNSNFQATYNGKFRHVLGSVDGLVDLKYGNPDYHNFFYGIGNFTSINEALDEQDYYQVAIKRVSGHVGLEKDFWRKSYVRFTTGVEHVESVLNQDFPTILSGNISDIPYALEEVTSLTGKVELDLDFRDEKGLPYYGIRFYTSFLGASVLNQSSERFSIYQGSIEYYLSTQSEKPLTLGLRVGGIKGFNKVPFHYQPNLGSGSGLRGYARYRFTGRSALYFNSELRYQFLDRETTIIPLKFGFKIFSDVGIIWDPVDEVLPDRNDWKLGYGFGFYMVPYTESLTFSISFGFSEEESFLPRFSLGVPLR